MAGYSTAAKNAMLDHLATLAVWVSAHNGDPGDSGANEVAGVARKAITWNAASAGAIDSSNQPAFDMGAGDTIDHVGYWTASAGGTFQGSHIVTSETFAGAGTYTLTDADLDLNG